MVRNDSTIITVKNDIFARFERDPELISGFFLWGNAGKISVFFEVKGGWFLSAKNKMAIGMNAGNFAGAENRSVFRRDLP